MQTQAWHAAIVKLDPLPDPVWSAAKNNDLFFVRGLRFGQTGSSANGCSYVEYIVGRWRSLEFCSARVRCACRPACNVEVCADAQQPRSRRASHRSASAARLSHRQNPSGLQRCCRPVSGRAGSPCALIRRFGSRQCSLQVLAQEPADRSYVEACTSLIDQRQGDSAACHGAAVGPASVCPAQERG